MKRYDKRGFTLLELVIVVAAIVILSAVLIPTFSNVIDKANTSADIQLICNANRIISAEDDLQGRSISADEADGILLENGVNINNKTNDDNEFYYIAKKSMYVIFSKKENRIIYPELANGELTGLNEVSNITYNLNGGEDAADKSYTVSDTIKLPSPTKKGYIFKGWLLESPTDGWDAGIYEAGKIGKGHFGDVTFSAQWEAKTFTIRYHLNDGSDKIAYEENVKYGEYFKIKSADELSIQREGYTFNSWCCFWNHGTNIWNQEEGTWNFDTGEMGIGDNKSEPYVLDLYAKWDEVK